MSIDVRDMKKCRDGYRYILRCIDHHSCYVNLYPMRGKSGGKVVAKLRNYITAYGSPEKLVSDNGCEFQNGEMESLCKEAGITQHFITPYHPQSNGVVERVRGSIKPILCALGIRLAYQWPKYLNWCGRSLNEWVHSTTGTTPYWAFFKGHPKKYIEFRVPDLLADEEGLELAEDSMKEQRDRAVKTYSLTKQKCENSKKNLKCGSLVQVKREVFDPYTSCKPC